MWPLALAFWITKLKDFAMTFCSNHVQIKMDFIMPVTSKLIKFKYHKLSDG